jgi:23S rRNA (uracil1939-C5)-methyltransferase
MKIKNIECIDISFEGLGVVKNEGQVIFVNDLLPGEIADIVITQSNKRYKKAIVEKYIKRNELTRSKYDQADAQDFAHMNYDYQLEVKHQIAQKYFKNIKLESIEESPLKTNYRNKTQIQVFFENGTYTAAYFKQKTNQISENKINLCDKKEHIELIDYIIERINFEKIIIGLNQIMIRSNSKGEMLLNLYVNRYSSIVENFARELFEEKNIKGIFYSIRERQTFAPKIIIGDKHLTEKLGSFNIEIGINEFFQINYEQMNTAYDYLIKNIEQNNQMILDFYCGIGTISLLASQLNKTVIGVESNKASVKAAKKFAKQEQIDNLTFLEGKSEKIIKQMKFDAELTTVIVDPPRTGLNSDLVKSLNTETPSQIIYMSCDGNTLSRDINKLSDQYTVKSIKPFDMFPNTHHIEYVCILEKK